MKNELFYFVYIWPEPKSSAAGLRSLDLLKSFLSAEWKITAFSPSKENQYSAELNALGIRTVTLPANQSEQDSFLWEQNPQLLIFDRFVMEEQFGWKCREIWPQCPQIVDTQDLHFLRRAREKSPMSLQSIAEAGTIQSEDRLRELSSLFRADAALVVSTFEEELLLSLGFPRENLLCLPLYAETEKTVRGFSEREGFCFLGNFRHPPNADAVKYLQELWPILQKEFPATLHLYGAYPPAAISALKNSGKIISHGPVQDHRAAISKHRVLLAPLRFGAGIKGKILEAWSTGTPVLGTKLSFEGMQGEGQVFENDFVPKALALYKNEPLWQAEQSAGLIRIEKFFSPTDLRQRILRFTDEMRANLPGRRQRNTIGQMLRHHQSNSMKYFSRWIEEKNKRAENFRSPL